MIQHATTAQVLEAFAKQDDRQMLALKQAAHRYLGGTHFSDLGPYSRSPLSHP